MEKRGIFFRRLSVSLLFLSAVHLTCAPFTTPACLSSNLAPPQKAADAVANLPHEVENGESLMHIPGIGKGIAAKVDEYLDEQDSDYEESECSDSLSYAPSGLSRYITSSPIVFQIYVNSVFWHHVLDPSYLLHVGVFHLIRYSR